MLKPELTFSTSVYCFSFHGYIYMFTPRRFMYGPDGQHNVPHREWLIIFDRVLLEVKEEMRQNGRADDFFGARV